MGNKELLKGKKLLFLGSSVTYGHASQGVSFVDFIAERNGCTVIKEAVSGTTLVDDSSDSYLARLRNIDKNIKPDFFTCQLSTNDASLKKNLGRISESFDISDFDTKTVAGAVEYVIAYVRNTWNCPIMFYTNPRYGSMEYSAMVEVLHMIQEKWRIHVLDLWNDTDFCNISATQRSLYMADDIHPTREGYLKWWTPYFEKFYTYHANI